MKNAILLFVILGLYFSASAQKSAPICYCPTQKTAKVQTTYAANTKATRIFDLGKGKSIALCGYDEKELIKGKTLYSEFTLSTCGSTEAIAFWGALETCNVKAINDTLFVEILKWLPVTPTAKETPVTWTIERLYFAGNKLNRTLTVNAHLPRYSPAQIAATLSLYSHYNVNDNSDEVAELANKLLICAISGSKQAENYLKTFPHRFKNLDGATAESYDDTYRMLQLWQKQAYKTVNVQN